MAEVCACDASFKNTGTDCTPLIGLSERFIFQSILDSNGDLNFIDATAVLNDAFFKAKINAADVRDRLFFLPRHKNPTSERGDSTFQSFEDQTKIFVHKGVRSWTVQIVGKDASPMLYGKLEAYRCADFGLYIVDRNRSLVGSSHSENGKVYPIKVDQNTFDVKYQMATATTAPSIMIMFDIDNSELDEELVLILASEMSGVNLLSYKGLLDVNATYLNITTTGFDAALSLDYGTAKVKLPVEGLVIGDFALFNVTTSTSITITSVTEVSEGVYTFVIPAQSSGDVLRLTPTKQGFDFANVVAKTILIP